MMTVFACATIFQLLLVVPLSVTSFTTLSRTSFISQRLSDTNAVVGLKTSSFLQSSTQQGDFEYALIFDCDGVIIETEELHRLAYNAAFKAADLRIDGEPVE